MPTAAHEITEDVDSDFLAARLEALRTESLAEAGGAVPTFGTRPVQDYRLYSPLADAAKEYIKFARSGDKRIYLGIKPFDDAMRGLAPGELMLIVGYAHSGKTVVTTKLLQTNSDRRVVFFTPDETRVLVLIKLASLVHRISAEVIEQRIADGDQEMEQLLEDVAETHFPNLAVFDQGVTLNDMDRAWDEVTDVWAAPPELVVFDYLDLLSGSGEDVPSKMNAIKAWGKNHEVPLIVLHQSSRTSGKDGQAVTMSSGGYGGEQQAMFMLGVRRKKNEIAARIAELETKLKTKAGDTSAIEVQLSEAKYDFNVHRDTVSLNLLKNKRPPSRLVDEQDFTLDAETGRIRPLQRPSPTWSEPEMEF